MIPNKQDEILVEIVRLSSRLQLSGFRCGVHEIDRWAQKSAHKIESSGRCRVFLLREQGGVSPYGFYSLSLKQETPSKLPDADDRSSWKYGAPFLNVDYVAVLRSKQGNGFGKLMLTNAMRQAISLCSIAPVYGVALTSMNAATQTFYESLGFSVAPDEHEKAQKLMVLPMKTIRDLMGE